MEMYGTHAVPGRLFIVEGIDGSGKSTQLSLLHRWLESEGYTTVFSEWNTSPLVKKVTRRGKKKKLLTPMTFSLIHATDFADRTEHQIIPPLKAGSVVLADRYIYTAFARDVARGVDREWVRGLYGFAVKPTVGFYFRVSLDVVIGRLRAARAGLKFYEAGAVVLANRYIFTAFARDVARGVDREWVRGLYAFAVKPTVAFYFRVEIEEAIRRLRVARTGFKFYEAGADVGLADDLEESFRLFQTRLIEEYERMVEEFGLVVIDASLPIEEQQEQMRRVVADAVTGVKKTRSSRWVDLTSLTGECPE